jgi:hypothetical protein
MPTGVQERESNNKAEKEGSLSPALTSLVARYREECFGRPDLLGGDLQITNRYVRDFLAALGWDTRDGADEVHHKEKTRIGGAPTTIDFICRVQGEPRFALIIPGGDWAHSSRVLWRYAWNAEVPLGVLSTFYKTVVFSCTKRPGVTGDDTPQEIASISYLDYPDSWDSIRSLLGRDADPHHLSRGVPPWERAQDVLLTTLEGWREEIAKRLMRQNLSGGKNDLNHTASATILAAVLCRVLADRGYIACEEEDLIPLISSLAPWISFQLTPWDEGDTSATLIREVVTALSPNWTPFEFAVLPVTLLAGVFDRLLMMRVSSQDRGVFRARERTWVRRSGGVSTLPGRCREYLIRRAFQEIARSRSLTGAPVTVFDPVCGAGELLSAAARAILVSQEEGIEGGSPSLQSRSQFKHRLHTIVQCIFGADCDPLAGEVARTMLFFTALDGTWGCQDTRSTPPDWICTLTQEIPRVLCGNTLIGGDPVDEEILTARLSGSPTPVRSLDLRAFAAPLTGGGFDLVLCDLPASPILPGKAGEEYVRAHYETFQAGGDLSVAFAEMGISLLRPGGVLAMVAPRAWLSAAATRHLRRFLNRFQIIEIVLAEPVHNHLLLAPLRTVILISNSHPTQPVRITRVGRYTHEWSTRADTRSHNVAQNDFGDARGWDLSDHRRRVLSERLARAGTPLDDLLLGEISSRVLPHRDLGRDRTTPSQDKDRIKGIRRYEPLREGGANSPGPRGERDHEAGMIIAVTVSEDTIHATLCEGTCSPPAPCVLLSCADRFLLGVLNSSLMQFYWKVTHDRIRVKQGRHIGSSLSELRSLPVKTVDFDNHHETGFYHQVVALVDQMLSLHRGAERADDCETQPGGPQSLKTIRLDLEIDSLVYSLYALSEGEVALIKETLQEH